MRAYVINMMVILIIFSVILHTDINVIMLSIGGQGAHETQSEPTGWLYTKMAYLPGNSDPSNPNWAWHRVT